MLAKTNCNTATLSPYSNPLGEKDVLHLYRRAGFGLSYNNIQNQTGKSAAQLATEIVTEAINLATTDAPEWATWDNTFYPEEDGEIKRGHINEWKNTYVNQLRGNNLRDRLSFFWHNHFVTELKEYNCPSYLYGYFNLLQLHAVGNFKTFVHDIGIDYAMLTYLNGDRSGKGNPNENYARELYELFTMGEGIGYTEEDIKETARALTGYTNRNEGCGEIIFNPDAFDDTTKTIFGQTGSWVYSDIIDILFEQRPNEVANFICGKLYEFFVNPLQIPEITQELANTFIDNDFELAPVLIQLFSSEHFFDEEARGVIIKSHYDVFLNFVNESGFSINDDLLMSGVNICGMIGQEIFNPVDVAGWQRDRDWIGPNTMIGRWKMLEFYLNDVFGMDEEQFANFAMDIAGGPGNTDPEDITRQIVDWFLPLGLHTPEDYNICIDVFKSNVPQNYYDEGNWNLLSSYASTQVFQLLQHLIKQPEFQLK
ncbi:DUF1800 domain-containing protein [Galbibacter pacificus]|uniref:DUF1800 domain-containing protein n=1 Tax=Galbibacter pacificus TaxID=2996052 RepID=A0ABT6FTC1_9FLAO|nr:DUF1800 domain-containing protein [Galbibacter pacificus]MDG3583020.1 DUF1800 domain-containing protein [Galbibacter pacificus]MDG3586501.1 DUF1800 domain-containing protein [Galbibacter pacificus]